MKETLLNMLEQTNEDAIYKTHIFVEESGRYKSGSMTKSEVICHLEKFDNVKPNPAMDIIMAGNIGFLPQDFSQNIAYPTSDTEGYEKHVSKYNDCYTIYIKLDKENKLISFKLGEKERTLELIEKTGFVSKPYYKKALKIVSVEDLDNHIHDDFWNPRMINIGRKILGFKEFSIAK